MIGSVLSAWLKDEGLSRSSIGLFGAIFAVYSINFLWSPLLDRLRLPYLGQRRGWIFTMQLSIAALCGAMYFIDITQDLYLVAVVGLLIAISSATQDIAIDAYRIDIIKPDEKDSLSAASSLATAGWWTGFGGLGAIPFFLADLSNWDWQQIYLVLAGITLAISGVTIMSKEPDVDREKIRLASLQRYQGVAAHSPAYLNAISQWLMVTLIAPFEDFFRRNGVAFALTVIGFIFMFKIGEAFLGRMSIVFYKEIGFTNAEIGTYSKLLNWWVTILFSIVGGVVNIRFGIYRGLMIAGIAMAASNLMFSLIATVGPDKGLFTLTIIVDGFTGAWASVATVAFISLLCNRAFSATQYALMASLSVLGRTLLASSSGFIVDGLDGNWSLFFAITAVMVVPGLCLLYAIKDKVNALERGEQQASS